MSAAPDSKTTLNSAGQGAASTTPHTSPGRSAWSMRRNYITVMILEVVSLIGLWWLQSHFG